MTDTASTNWPRGSATMFHQGTGVVHRQLPGLGQLPSRADPAGQLYDLRNRRRGPGRLGQVFVQHGRIVAQSPLEAHQAPQTR
jgi:hypothetical protein